MSQTAQQHLEAVVDELARLAGAKLAPVDFYTTLLDRGSAALAATAAASWSGSANGQLGLDCQLHWHDTSLADDLDRQIAHALLLQAVLRNGNPRLVPPHAALTSDLSTVAGNGQPINPTEHLLALAPWSLDDQSGVLELFLRPGGSPAAQQGYLQFAAALADIVLEYQRNSQLRVLQERDIVWQEFERFIGQVHAGTDVDRVCYAIANEGRRLCQCDRVSVVLQRAKHCQVAAVSGLESVNRRANAIRKLEQLVQSVTMTGQPLWYYGSVRDDSLANHHGNTQPPAPQIEAPLHAYLEESHAKMLAVVPLTLELNAAANEHRHAANSAHEPPPLGALVIEQFDRTIDDGLLSRRVTAVARHAAPALRNALEIERLPLISINRGLGRIGWLVQAKQLPKTTLALIAAVIAVLALILIPADFTIEGTGELQPVERRDIFAPTDGIVDTVDAQHAAIVTAGQRLLSLRSPSLDFEEARVSGELQTAKKRLVAVQIARLDLDLIERDKTANKQSQLTAEEEEIKEQIKSLTAQQSILNAQLSDLEIRSPLNGQIVTWDVARLLSSRPVGRGQKLLTVADTEGRWSLELHVPDDKIGYVLAARQQAILDQRPLEVDFMLAAEPAATYRGTVEKIALRTDPDRRPEPSVLVTVRFDRRDSKTLRPGATVIGKIDCGRRSLGFVWFHAAWNAIQRRLLF